MHNNVHCAVLYCTALNTSGEYMENLETVNDKIRYLSREFFM